MQVMANSRKVTGQREGISKGCIDLEGELVIQRESTFRFR
jgi:hypothetical protein